MAKQASSSTITETPQTTRKLRPRKQAATPNGTTKRSKNLDAQYGGNSSSGWPSLLPASFLPYIQLARLSPPAGLFLIFFPHAFGLLHGAIITSLPWQETLRVAGILLLGSFFLSNAIHIWNDLIDAPLDARVERTKNRPIPRGAVSPTAALVFTATQAVGGIAVLLYYVAPKIAPAADGGLLGDFEKDPAVQALLYAVPSMMLWTYYPWAKRHTMAPQVVLGICLAWGIVMGEVAVGREPFAVGGVVGSAQSKLEKYAVSFEPGVTCLVFASTLWTCIYDTIYAHQDVQDDIKAGIKSLAVLYQDKTKTLLWPLLGLMLGLLVAVGRLAEMSIVYYTLAVGGAGLSLGSMIWNVDLKDTGSCWWWFGNGFWFTGGGVVAGLLLQYVLMIA